MLESNSANFLDEEDFDNDEDNKSWVVNGVNVIQECRDYRDDCFAKRNPEQLDDTGMLAMNHVYLFAEAPSSSITRHFENMNGHHAIVLGLGVSDMFTLASSETYGWCATCASRSYATWREAQATTIGFLNQGLQSNNELDLIVANVLHQLLSTMKIVEYTGQRGKDTFIYDIIAPLLNINFSFNINLNNCWEVVSWVLE